MDSSNNTGITNNSSRKSKYSYNNDDIEVKSYSDNEDGLQKSIITDDTNVDSIPDNGDFTGLEVEINNSQDTVVSAVDELNSVDSDNLDNLTENEDVNNVIDEINKDIYRGRINFDRNSMLFSYLSKLAIASKIPISTVLRTIIFEWFFDQIKDNSDFIKENIKLIDDEENSNSSDTM